MKPLAHRRHGRDLVTITVAAVGILLGSAVGARGAEPLPGRWTWTPDGGACLTRDRLGLVLHQAAVWRAQAEELPAALDALEASRREAEALRAEVAALRSSLALVTKDRDSLSTALVTERAARFNLERSRGRWRGGFWKVVSFVAGGVVTVKVAR